MACEVDSIDRALRSRRQSRVSSIGWRSPCHVAGFPPRARSAISSPVHHPIFASPEGACRSRPQPLVHGDPTSLATAGARLSRMDRGREKKKVAAACVGRGAGLGRRGAASGQWELPGRVRRRRPANQLWPGSGVPATVARLCRCRAHCRGRAPASRIRRRAPSRRGGRGSSEPPARPRPSVVCRHSPPPSRVLPRWREVAQDRGTQGGRRAAVCRWPKPAAAAAPLPPSPSRPAPPPAAPSAAVVAVYFLPCRHEPHGWHEGPEPR